MDTPYSPEARRMTKLLGLLVGLTAILVVGLAIGGLVAWREYRQLRSAMALALGEQRMSPGDVVNEVSTRQRAASTQLAEMVSDSERQIAQFEKRAASIRDKGGGPIDSAEKALDATQLMADQMILLLKQTTTLQDVLAKGARPFAGPAQDEKPEERSPLDARPRSARRAPR
jgi:hypothetical protein